MDEILKCVMNSIDRCEKRVDTLQNAMIRQTKINKINYGKWMVTTAVIGFMGYQLDKQNKRIRKLEKGE